MILLGMHLAGLLGLDGRAQLDPAGIEHETLQGVLADLRAEPARRGWTT